MYLKTFGICLIVGMALGAPKGGSGGDAKKPVPPTKVNEIDCEKMKSDLELDAAGSFDFCVKIGFPKGERVLYGGLTIYTDVDGEKYKDVYKGKVIAQKAGKWLPVEGTRISMTIKPKVTKATMMINDGEELYELEVDLKRGEAKPDHLPPNYAQNNDEKPLKEELQDRWDNKALRKTLQRAYENQVNKPKSVVLRIQFVAEQYFVDEYGSKKEVRKRIMGVANHLETMYSHHSLPVVINVRILSILFMNDRVLIAGSNIGPFGQYAAKMVAAGTWPQADTYILLGPKNQKDFYGVANGGWNLNEGVCSTNVEKKVSINWYEASTDKTEGYSDDLLTALTVVHENGHNLGMRHDFYDTKEQPTRYALTYNRCKGVRGFMDYVFPPYTSSNEVPVHFSDCSGEDWQAHYMQVVQNRGRYCLETTCDNGKECIPPCEDKNTNCNRYKEDGDCSNDKWKVWMHENCRKSCLSVDDTDLEDVCKQFKDYCGEGTLGYTSTNWLGQKTDHELHFYKSCKKTCGYC